MSLGTPPDPQPFKALLLVSEFLPNKAQDKYILADIVKIVN